MLRCRAVLGLVMTATMLPALPAYPAQPAPSAAPTETSANLQLQVPVSPAPTPAAASAPAADAPSLNVQSRTTELKFEADPTTFYALPRHDNHHYGMASGSMPAGALNLAPSSAAARAGWGFSGRVGPVRWLTPLDGEGETKMRFGGRIPGQPRLPGTGNFSVSIHYAFE
jgi:hypothetical protein